MTTTYTSVLPANLVAIHVTAALGYYYRFEKNYSQAPVHASGATASDDASFNGTSVTFSVGSGNVTITKATGMVKCDVITANGTYYRFESGVTVLPLQGADVSGTFASITFTAT